MIATAMALDWRKETNSAMACSAGVAPHAIARPGSIELQSRLSRPQVAFEREPSLDVSSNAGRRSELASRTTHGLQSAEFERRAYSIPSNANENNQRRQRGELGLIASGGAPASRFDQRLLRLGRNLIPGRLDLTQKFAHFVQLVDVVMPARLEQTHRHVFVQAVQVFGQFSTDTLVETIS